MLAQVGGGPWGTVPDRGRLSAPMFGGEVGAADVEVVTTYSDMAAMDSQMGAAIFLCRSARQIEKHNISFKILNFERY